MINNGARVIAREDCRFSKNQPQNVTNTFIVLENQLGYVCRVISYLLLITGGKILRPYKHVWSNFQVISRVAKN